VKTIAAIASLAVLGLFAGNALAASEADRAFETLSDQYLNEVIEFSPVGATAMGDHRADDRLDEVDAAARERERTAFVGYRDRLAAIDAKELTRVTR
jgi:hypothetical protein